MIIKREKSIVNDNPREKGETNFSNTTCSGRSAAAVKENKPKQDDALFIADRRIMLPKSSMWESENTDKFHKTIEGVYCPKDSLVRAKGDTQRTAVLQWWWNMAGKRKKKQPRNFYDANMNCPHSKGGILQLQRKEIMWGTRFGI